MLPIDMPNSTVVGFVNLPFDNRVAAMGVGSTLKQKGTV